MSAEIDFSSIPSGVDLSPENLERLDSRATEAATAFARKIEKLQTTVIDAADRFRAERQSMIDSALPDDRRSARQMVERDVSKRVSELRRQIVTNSETERAEILRALEKHAREAELVESLCRSPAQMLGRVGLGEARRTQLQTQLTGAGPAELISAATQAVSTGDLVLAAAVLTVADRMGKNRPFSTADFAARVMGTQHAALQARLDGIRQRARAAADLEREFVRGRSDPLSKISRGLATHKTRGN